MPDIRYTVWNLDKIPELPKEKQVEILIRLQKRIHELHDALELAYDWILDGEINKGEFSAEPELQPMFKIMNERMKK